MLSYQILQKYLQHRIRHRLLHQNTQHLFSFSAHMQLDLVVFYIFLMQMDLIHISYHVDT
nr:MAG TPA: hypothetical protein [Crassvirales sp.]